ncbi:flagellar biosynthesis regulatory protein FlaF [Cypionkella aquatica]|uniref:Flagellar biosynthesis regulatory protein FlaF n=1 Tax=Cypionkella aquatica TaxID=1756042 RepID=A0AA37TZN1_9RHOB|nr:flagellar biosynthesis regulator FlaF [Cypionkella aquatica]GLS85180.1 flagellar biosynthesis regulatory protein FlaF [Cypionkella aquatica]
MTAHFTAARSVYARPEAPQKTPRSLEYDLLARITQRLTQAAAARRENHPGFIAALDENLRLWSTLAADVADAGNTLPQKLRAQLFYLYEFTSLHSRAIRNDKGSVEVLVDINTAVMRGLRGHGGDA